MDQNQTPVVKTPDQLRAEIKALQAEQKVLLQNHRAGMAGKQKIAEKGGVSFYLGGTFPVTLSPERWAIVAEHISDIVAFCEANKTQIAAARAAYLASKKK